MIKRKKGGLFLELDSSQDSQEKWMSDEDRNRERGRESVELMVWCEPQTGKVLFCVAFIINPIDSLILWFKYKQKFTGSSMVAIA